MTFQRKHILCIGCCLTEKSGKRFNLFRDANNSYGWCIIQTLAFDGYGYTIITLEVKLAAEDKNEIGYS